MEKDSSGIPVYELHHEGEEVAFAIRTAKDVMAMFGLRADKPHRHNYYTMLWSHNYSGRHIIDYTEFEMQPNHVFFVSPGQVHQVIHNDTPQVTVILFTCEFLNRNAISEDFITNLNLFSEISNTQPVMVDQEAAERMQRLVDDMCDTFLQDEPFKNDMIGAYLKLFLIECNKFAHLSLAENTQALQSGRRIVKRFKDLLEEKYVVWKKVQNYADALNLSPDYLNSVIKDSVGKTAKELIQQRLILESKRLGLHTGLSNKEIAYQIGFGDPSHFSRFFKNAEGISFSNFRDQLQTEMQG